jgi:hypothetical protein
MARLPGWIVAVDRGRLSEDGRSVLMTFRVRRWHPGFWIAVLRYRIHGCV